MAISDELALLLQSKESIKDSINEKVGSEIIDDNTPFDYYPNKILDIKGLPHEYSSGATASGATSYERVASHLAILSSTKQNMANAIKDCGVGGFDEDVLSAYSAAIEIIEPHDPLTFNVISGGNIYWLTTSYDSALTITYRKNTESTWHTWTSTPGSYSGYIRVNAGDKILFKGDNNCYDGNYFRSTAKFEAEGNIMSLIDSTGFTSATTLESNYAFKELFSNCSGLTSAENLVLPATVLSFGCYQSMFSGCTSLTTAPELPATTLANYCYASMFSNCSGLTTAPELPATTVAECCYRNMFNGCTSLTTAPTSIGISATTMPYMACFGMFSGCTSLTTEPELPATILGNACYSLMFAGCTSLTTAPELPATTVAQQCYYHMFSNCSGLTQAPSILPATTLVYNCYGGMFNGCKSLTTAPVISKTSGIDYAQNSDYMEQMFYGCSKLSYIKCLPSYDKTPYSHFYRWTYGVASSGVFVKNRANNDWENGVNGIPSGWTVVNYGFSDTQLGIPLTGYSATYNFYVDEGTWTAYTEDSWVTLTNATGDTAHTTFGISITQTETPRYGKIYVVDSNNIVSELQIVQDYKAEYLTFNILSGGTISWRTSDSYNSKPISYSKDFGSTWTTISSTTAGYPISVSAGDVIKFKSPSYQSSYFSNSFSSSNVKFTIEGNIASLFDSRYFSGSTYFARFDSSAFYRFFAGCTGLTSAENLIINADYLDNSSCQEMFQGCTSLTTAPELNLTQLGTQACCRMFANCTSLTKAPSRVGTSDCKFSTSACTGMFAGCTSLTTAPELPATSVSGAQYCYANMFSGCTSLTTAPELPATTLANYCYSNMFAGCRLLTTAPEMLPATSFSGANYCYYYMFFDCTSLTTAPVLPATTLANYCYYYMFYNCTSLNYIKCLATNTTSANSYGWVSNVASAGTFIKNSEATWETGNSGIPSGWTVYDADSVNIKEMKLYASESGDTVICDLYADNCTWTASTEDSWISLSTTTGNSGFTSISITVQSSSGVRTGNITFNDSYGNEKVLIIEQNDSYVTPLTFDIISGGTINWKTTNSSSAKTISYSTDNGSTWSDLVPTTTGVQISVNDGDKIMFKGDNASYGGQVGYYNSVYHTFSGSTAIFDIKGNIMSLIDSENYPTLKTVPASGFTQMFRNCNGIRSAENLVLPAKTVNTSGYYLMFTGSSGLTKTPRELPATTLASNCYYGMFQGCSGLTTAPTLIGTSATTMADSACTYMFSGCTSLTTAPELPATTLGNSCYSYMFAGCTSLTTAPELPATTLGYNCYSYMFDSCTSLTTAPTSIGTSATTMATSACTYMFFGCISLTTEPELPATTLANGCYYYMFNGCSSLTTAPELPATTLASNCYRSMFAGCTSLTTAPELPATTLASNCYRSMFQSCTSLTTVPSDYLPVTTLTDSCYHSMFANCSGLTTAPVLPATTLAEYCYSNMFRECTSLTTAPELPATTLANGCYSSMFSVCTSLTTAPELPATTLSASCYNGMFVSCTSLTTAPELPATNLAYSCYMQMFKNCTALTETPDLLTETLAQACYYGMFSGCTSLTGVTELPASALTDSCYYGMFAGCTSLATAPNLHATTLATSCYQYMFNGCSNLTTVNGSIGTSATTIVPTSACTSMFSNCTGLTTAPDLYGEILSGYSYYYMFNHCTSLNYVKCLVTDISAIECTYYWLGSVSKHGTFIKNKNMNNWQSGPNGIPLDWNVGDSDSAFFEKDKIYMKEDECERTIKVIADNVQWTASTEDSWLSISPTTGSGMYTNVTISAQSASTVRNGIITIVDSNNNETQLTIIQDNSYANPLTFNIISAGTVYWKASYYSATKEISYSKDDGLTWSAITSTTVGVPISVNAGDKVQFKGDNTTYGYSSTGTSCFSGTTAIFSVEGNLMSIFDSENYTEKYYIEGEYAAARLFSNCTTLISAENLTLPATNLNQRDYTYYGMFANCTSLKKSPKILPATSLSGSSYCYQSMFADCTSLTTVPELPATTLSEYCYYGMFQGCSELTTAPQLPATKLKMYCYQYMFQYCYSLTTAPELPATTLANYCYSDMFANCSGLTTAPSILPATTLADSCYYEMFYNCKSLTTAPELPATTLAYRCYAWMFYNCKSLNYIKCLAKSPSTTNCSSWVDLVSSTGTFIKNPDASGWPTGGNGIPSGWDVYDEISISFDTKVIAESGSSFAVDVTSPLNNWTASTDDSWISISPSTGGTGTTNITVSVQSSNAPRRGKVTLIDDSGSKKELTILQDDRRFKPLTFNIISGGTIKFYAYGYQYLSISYSKDDGQTWDTITSSSAGANISVNAGDKVLIVGDNSNYGFSNGYYNYFSSSNAKFTVEGNIMSLISSTNYQDKLYLDYTYTFSYLFRYCYGIVSAENLVLPLNVKDYCYYNMFYYCTGLTITPELPATTLANYCYQNMFYGCTSLNYIKCLATDISASNCTYNWVGSVSSTGTFVKNPNMSSWTSGASGIPNGWTVQDAS